MRGWSKEVAVDHHYHANLQRQNRPCPMSLGVRWQVQRHRHRPAGQGKLPGHVRHLQHVQQCLHPKGREAERWPKRLLHGRAENIKVPRACPLPMRRAHFVASRGILKARPAVGVIGQRRLHGLIGTDKKWRRKT